MGLKCAYFCVCLLTHNWNTVFSEEKISQLNRSNERDYIFNLFEKILTKLDSKSKQMEKLDQKLYKLDKRLDAMEGKITQTLDISSKFALLLENKMSTVCTYGMDSNPLPKITRKVRHRPPFDTDPIMNKERNYYDVFSKNNKRSSPRVTETSSIVLMPIGPTTNFRLRNINKNHLKFAVRTEKNNVIVSKLGEVAEKISDIDSKLSTLQLSLDGNAISKNSEELLAAGSESYGVGLGLQDSTQDNSKLFDQASDLIPLQQTVDDVKNSLNSVDRRLEIHANAIGHSFAEMTGQITTLKGALNQLNKEKEHQTCVRKQVKNGMSNSTECITPFDELREEMHMILQTVVEKREESLGIKEGQTKQAKTLDRLQKQVSDITSKILAYLFEVRQESKNYKKSNVFNSGGINPIALLQRTSAYERKSHTPQTIINHQELLEKNGSPRDNLHSDNFRHSGVIFPQKIHRPAEYSFASTSSEINAGGYSCLELMEKGEKKDGVYHLKIKGTTYWFLQAYCDMTTSTGGWTVIQRRDDFGRPRESFNRGWEEYKHGFGNPKKEFWLGNENIFMLTNTEDYSLRVNIEDFDGNKKYAEYSRFKLHSEDDKYKLEIGGYTGNAGDSLNDPWYGSNLSPFSTFDNDHDRSSLNCAAMLKGGWWWRSCGRGLNGLYYTKPKHHTAREGIIWFRYKGWDDNLKKAVLMIKPKNSPSISKTKGLLMNLNKRNISLS